jgi:hypothetical protein
MASEAIIRQDRPNVAVELNLAHRLAGKRGSAGSQ